jgi:ADP-ribosylglycohydrolase
VLHGADLAEAIEKGCDEQPGPGGDLVRIRRGDALAMQDKTVVDATGLVGRSCYLPCTFPSILHACLRYSDDFATAVLETVRAGGDNASRAACVGSLLGAAIGSSRLPGRLVEQLNARAEINELVDRLLSFKSLCVEENGFSAAHRSTV